MTVDDRAQTPGRAGRANNQKRRAPMNQPEQTYDEWARNYDPFIHERKDHR